MLVMLFNFKYMKIIYKFFFYGNLLYDIEFGYVSYLFLEDYYQSILVQIKFFFQYVIKIQYYGDVLF